uniref:uncharacterized protein LOC114599926 n=1 Tax=Podarcis muralis TaxID=64176 RepID=UPI00109F552D|nr:uncharacterized protein LOC114599926 [Podarcis muralis]
MGGPAPPKFTWDPGGALHSVVDVNSLHPTLPEIVHCFCEPARELHRTRLARRSNPESAQRRHPDQPAGRNHRVPGEPARHKQARRSGAALAVQPAAGPPPSPQTCARGAQRRLTAPSSPRGNLTRSAPSEAAAPSHPRRASLTGGRRVLAAGPLGSGAPLALPSLLRPGRAVGIRPSRPRVSNGASCPRLLGSGARGRLASPRPVSPAGLPGVSLLPLGTRAQPLQEAPLATASGCLCSARCQPEPQPPPGAAGRAEAGARKDRSDPYRPPGAFFPFLEGQERLRLQGSREVPLLDSSLPSGRRGCVVLLPAAGKSRCTFIISGVAGRNSTGGAFPLACWCRGKESVTVCLTRGCSRAKVASLRCPFASKATRKEMHFLPCLWVWSCILGVAGGRSSLRSHPRLIGVGVQRGRGSGVRAYCAKFKGEQRQSAEFQSIK